ncbi:hypothetical protein [Nocardia wallacei]|uniref:hypothetical protein n=1 Tax=Nocardia wallacei TaxID=480035 RepID=UPI002454A759|nr:hypothetical protein [Nocardia wallacei]
MPYNTLAIHQLAAMTEPETHLAPDIPFSIVQAHTIMQFHVACRARKCPRKAAALHVLIEVGRVVASPIHPR